MTDPRYVAPVSCPDPEVLAAYVEHGLPPAEHARVEAHLAGCGDCLALVGEIGRAVEEFHQQVPEVPEVPEVPGVPGVPEVPEVPKVLRVPRVPRVHGARRWLAAGGAGLALAASLLLVARVAPERVPAWLGGSDVDPRFAALVEAVGEQRYVEPRLTGGFRYGPLRSATRSGSGVQTANLALLAAAGELQKAADADPTPENLHAWGVAQLLLERYDDAVHTLRAVVGADPTAPRYRADLAAALAARAAHTGNPEDWQAALDAARLARGLEPSMAEALFTEALALEAIDRGFESQAAWQRYLRWDQDSEWAAEAQRRLGLRSDPPK